MSERAAQPLRPAGVGEAAAPAADDRLVAQLAGRIRGVLRAAGANGLSIGAIKALAGYGWTSDQLARALADLGAVEVPVAPRTFTVDPPEPVGGSEDERDDGSLAAALPGAVCECSSSQGFVDDPLDPRCWRCGKAAA